METKELWMDEEFCKKVDAASNTEEIIRLFAGKGVTVALARLPFSPDWRWQYE